MLANHAEAINGLLYMVGGGWTDHRRHMVPGQPSPPSSFSIALSVFTPWGETNKPVDLNVSVEDDDGAVLFKVDTKLVTGRPPQIPPGAGQHVPMAINAVIGFPKQGGYRVVVKLDGERDTRTWPFRVHDIPPQNQ